MTIHPLATYFADCLARHKTGTVTPEISYYGPLETLLTTVGARLKKPRVRCFMSFANTGGNMPDGGLFDELRNQAGQMTKSVSASAWRRSMNNWACISRATVRP